MTDASSPPAAPGAMGQLRALIKAMVPTGGHFVVADIADKVLVAAEETMGDQLAALQRQLTVRVIAAELRAELHARRQSERRLACRADLDTVVAALTNGEVSPFAQSFCVDKDDTWKAVGEMTGADHRFVAAAHTKKSGTERLLAAFHREVAKQVGQQCTADVMSEADYLRLEASILNRST